MSILAKQQLKRDTETNIDGMTLLTGEPAIATDTGKIVIYDGAAKKKYSADDAVNNIELTNIAHGASRGIMHYAGASFTPTLLAAPVDGYVLKGGGTTTDLAFEAINASEVVAGTYPAGDHIFSRVLSYGGGLVTSNVAIGTSALNANTTGATNTAVGAISLASNLVGTDNTAVGYVALNSNTGINNTAIGRSALSTTTTGGNCTGLGYNAQSSSATASNEVTLGDGTVSAIRCQVQVISALSDERDKKNIKDIPVGLDFINRLKPREFDWNMRDGGKVDIKEFGFVAQELLQAQKDEGVTVPGLVYDSNPDKLEAAYGYLVPSLVKAVQELTAQNKALEARLAALEA
jgi:hypothetical protein